MQVRIPYDAMPGTYELQLMQPGAYQIIADQRTPLVLYAPGAWRPAYTRPATRIYFQVPADARGARIHFENGAVLVAPDGAALHDGAPVSGWQELPEDQPGLWSFEPAAPGMVRGEQFPPYYAMGDPAFHFIPARNHE